MEWSGEDFGLDSQHSLQIDVVKSDLDVVIAVSEDEISVEFGCFKGEFIFANESVTPLRLEVQDLIVPAR